MNTLFFFNKRQVKLKYIRHKVWHLQSCYWYVLPSITNSNWQMLFANFFWTSSIKRSFTSLVIRISNGSLRHRCLQHQNSITTNSSCLWLTIQPKKRPTEPLVHENKTETQTHRFNLENKAQVHRKKPCICIHLASHNKC